MSKKLTYDEVKSFVIENSDCELLSENYINSRTKMKFKCKCGKEFETSFHTFKFSNQRQCPNCGIIIRSSNKKLNIKDVKKYIEENSNCELISNEYIDAETKIIFKCSCGKLFKRSFHSFKSMNEKRCPSCAIKSGENNPNWNPNITDEERELGRCYPKYKQFVSKTMKRDKYTCQCCGGYSINLQVHHLNGYHWYKEGRTNINNAITLCKTCHKEFHSIYGRKNNTKEQYEEWINNKNIQKAI